MNLELNPRGNGACPICTHLKDCAIRRRLISSIADVSSPDGEGMEIAIFACPSFVEKDRP